MKSLFLDQNIELQVSPEKVVILPDFKTLILADLHLGKAEAFQAQGIPLPTGSDEGDLKILSDLVRRHDIRQVIIAGDVFHHPKSISENVRQLVRSWLDELKSCTVIFALGNHDRNLEIETPSNLSIFEEVRLSSDLLVSHHPAKPKDSGFRICGHLHPVVVLRSRQERLRLPCFVKDSNQLILPAFSSLAGGFEMKPSATRQLYAIAENQVIAL